MLKAPSDEILANELALLFGFAGTPDFAGGYDDRMNRLSFTAHDETPKNKK
jgi:hypothetical protein